MPCSGNLVGIIIAIVVLLLGFGFLRSAFLGTNPLEDYGDFGFGGYRRNRRLPARDYFSADDF